MQEKREGRGSDFFRSCTERGGGGGIAFFVIIVCMYTVGQVLTLFKPLRADIS